VDSSAGETCGAIVEIAPLRLCSGGLPTISVQSVAASPYTSLRGDVRPPNATSGAMYPGVPTPIVAARTGSCRCEMPKSTSTISPSREIRFSGFTSRCTICWSWTY
jgi:hypothetical protein